MTADKEVIARVSDARLLGVEKDSEKRVRGERSWEFDVAAQGWRYHMSNLNAAIGSVQLRRLDSEFGPARVRLARRYLDLLAGVEGLRTLPLEYGRIIPHIFPVLIHGGRRDQVRAALLAAAVECGIHYKPNHLLSLYGGGRETLPQAEKLYNELLTLPLHVELQPEDQEHIVRIIARELRGDR